MIEGSLWFCLVSLQKNKKVVLYCKYRSGSMEKNSRNRRRHEGEITYSSSEDTGMNKWKC